MLAAGVFLSGWLKDLVCVPRPLSPPLQRITMSGSAALEYGFPSTHSTNAVSVAVYLLHGLITGSIPVDDAFRTPAMIACYWFAISIAAGRIYCGMHGFMDVLVGILLGGLIAVAQIIFGPYWDDLVSHSGAIVPVLITTSLLLAIRFHPEPADDCPCFDDTVSFLSVVVGINLGHSHFAKSSYAWDAPVPGTVPFSLEQVGWVKTVLRLVIGVVIIFAWRAAMKPTLLRCLPPLFRQIEYVGLDLPRRFFTRASQYNRVPTLRRDDNVIPQAKEIPAFISNFSGRKRKVSVGPQSEADARELLAQREIQRRQSWRSLREAHRNGELRAPSTVVSPTEISPVADYLSVPTLPRQDSASSDNSDAEAERVLFHAIQKPRVRYDVEVVTRIVVYIGIALFSVDLNPILFVHIGLGLP